MEDSSPEYKTIDQVGELNDQQRMQYLLQQWSLSSPVIEGKPDLRNDLWWLTEVTGLNGELLEFPFSDLHDWRKSLQRGVFIGPKLPIGTNESARSVFSFSLASPAERKKQQNPWIGLQRAADFVLAMEAQRGVAEGRYG
ncbi:MAG: hypothetical protein WAM94_10715 [Chromatiaceae bacterium]